MCHVVLSEKVDLVVQKTMHLFVAGLLYEYNVRQSLRYRRSHTRRGRWRVYEHCRRADPTFPAAGTVIEPSSNEHRQPNLIIET